MKDMPLIILGGFETDLSRIEKKVSDFKENHDVHYLEGLPKGIVIKQDKEFLVQNIRNQSADASYIDQDRIFLTGPKWLYKNRLDGFKFVNTNDNLGRNLMAAFKAVGGGTVAITTNDSPFLKTEHIDDYISKILDKINDPKMAAIVQFPDKSTIPKEFLNAYDKPGYPLNNKRYTIGHFHICNIDNVNSAALSTVDLAYNVRGQKSMEMIKNVASEVLEGNLIKLRYALLPAIKPLIQYFILKNLPFDNLSKFIQKASRENIFDKDSPRFYMEPVEGVPFAIDVDTEEEVKKYNLEYTPIEKITDMSYKHFLEKSTISN